MIPRDIPYMVNVGGEKFLWFILNHISFPANHGLVDPQYKSTKSYSKSFTANSHFPLKRRKFSPMDVFSYMLYQWKVLDDELECLNIKLAPVCSTEHM